MKKTIKFLSALAICAATVSCNQQKTAETVTRQADSTVYVAAQGAIVYVDLDVILARYDMANELSSVVETKVQNIQAEVTRRGQKLEKAAKDLQEKMEKARACGKRPGSMDERFSLAVLEEVSKEFSAVLGCTPAEILARLGI